jgi:hypothetical protein
MRPVIPFVVEDNLEPVGGWHHFTGSQQLRSGATFPVGAATVTINSLEEFDDYLLLHVAIQATAANRLLVKAPEWIVIGHQLRFNSVDATGKRVGWHEGKMRSYEPRVGGEIAAGETAEGYVVLQKAAAEWALLLLYGSPNVTEEDGIMLRLPVQDGGIGFDPTGDFPGYLGLRSMRERLERLGGHLWLERGNSFLNDELTFLDPLLPHSARVIQ